MNLPCSENFNLNTGYIHARPPIHQTLQFPLNQVLLFHITQKKTAFLSRSSQLNLKHNALIVIKEQRKFRQIRNNFIYLPKIRAIKIQNLFNQLAGYFLLYHMRLIRVWVIFSIEIQLFQGFKVLPVAQILLKINF